MTESKKLLFSKTRWRPALGTLHKLTVWYEHVDFRTHALSAKKVFNFISNEAAQSLATFSDNSSHSALKATTNVEIWQISTCIAEKIIALSEIKTPITTSSTCLFKMKETSKNIHANITLESTEDGGFIGEVILSGYRKEPPTEVVNLISAIMIDDPWASKHWRKALYTLTACFAWLTRKSIQSLLPPLKKEPIPAPTIKPTPARCNAETQTEHAEYSELGMQTDCSEFADEGAQTELIATKDVEVQVKLAPEKREFSIQTDTEEQPTAHHTHQRREDTGESAPCAPEEIMPEISAASLHKMIYKIYKIEWHFTSNPLHAYFDSGRPIDYEGVPLDTESARNNRRDFLNKKIERNIIRDDGSLECSFEKGNARIIFLKDWTSPYPKKILAKKDVDWLVAIGCFEIIIDRSKTTSPAHIKPTIPTLRYYPHSEEKRLEEALEFLVTNQQVFSAKLIPLVLVKYTFIPREKTTRVSSVMEDRSPCWTLFYPNGLYYTLYKIKKTWFHQPKDTLYGLARAISETIAHSDTFRREIKGYFFSKKRDESLYKTPEEAILKTYLNFYKSCFSDQEHTHKPGASTK